MNASPAPIRGIMLDPARLIERPRVYRDLIPRLGRWGYNTLLWHFTDDAGSANQGCALRFPSHPEFAATHAFSVGQTRALIRLAARHGLQVIPEVECLGHTGYIRRARPHLADGMRGKMFGAIAPFLPETRAILAGLLADAAALFPAPYLHVGLDEVSLGDHPHTARLLAKWSKPELFARHIRWLHRTVKSLGKEMMIWGDHLLPLEKGVAADHIDRDAISAAIAREIPKDIIICDWHYGPARDFPSLDFFLGQGFRVVACPATSSYGMLVHPRTWNLRNVRDFNRAAWRRRANPRMLGTINTVWVGQRTLPGALLAGMALGAWAAAAGRPPADYRERVAADVFGFSPAQARRCATAIRALESASPHLDVWRKAYPVRPSDCDGIRASHRRALRAAAAAGARAGRILRSLRGEAPSAEGYLEDLIVAAQVFAASDLCLRARAVRGAKRKAALRAARRKIEAARDAGGRAWARSRFSDDPERDGGPVPGECCAMQQRLVHACRFLAELENQSTP